MKYANFILEPSRGFVFAYVPKVACTNWKALMRYMAGHEDWLDNRLAHDRARGGLRYLDPDGADAALLRRDDIPKYAMVRDPYGRTLSAYLNKVEKRLPPGPPETGEDPFRAVVRNIEAFRAARLSDTHPSIDFEVFLHWLRDSKSPFTGDEHWTPQSVLLRQPDMHFDMIGRFEDLERDAPRLLRAMGCDRGFPTQRDVNFAPSGAQSKLARYYTPAARALVEELFAADFDTFGYPRRDPAAEDPADAPADAPAARPGNAPDIAHDGPRNSPGTPGPASSTKADIMTDHSDILSRNWYYIAELSPGVFTPGRGFKNISVARRALEAITVKDAGCLDMSTMEGMFSILLSRRGARVTATDTIDNREKLEYLQKIYDAPFDYVPHAPVANYVDFMLNMQASRNFAPTRAIELGENTPYGYDLVLSSGVIYHVHNPIEHIVNFRRLCKTGGLVVLETAALMSDEIEMVHDWRGERQIYGGNATWYPSTRALEIFMRAAFLEPLGFTYINSAGQTDLKLARIAIVARAVTERPFLPEHEAIIRGSELYRNYDFKPIYPSARLTGRSQVAPAVDTSRLLPADDLRASAIREHPPLEYPEDYLTLKLDDR
ncbi:sulfotransferase family 2 domain-containing protein [Citreimonas salinaria]|uniref:Methyltransferase domain-containing protein n=1 Tax=Citreimonas salinaria TaxID=321339 RepID=A0A1H3N494_9RHOB|nr:sulfotransferase family 2 domain-containing protein [Citreimonas salinaria]SDY83781.1 Methyltransferase domain-containing protein [Citreimonas salinaria]